MHDFPDLFTEHRINFLELLRTGYFDYALNEEAFEYMQAKGFPKYLLPRLQEHSQRQFEEKSQWQQHLEAFKISSPRHLQIATEGALLGSILAHGVPQSLVILSDDAGKFKFLEHALCWIHAERNIKKLIPYTDLQKDALKKVRKEIWQFYQDLNAYKADPQPSQKVKLEARFETIFTQKTSDTTLNLALKRIHANKAELLLVLERPQIPLHNNLSERDIREYVKRRKISAGTRSEAGRRARDTFLSLKKTCRKLKISFWEYLLDRGSKTNAIPQLKDWVCQQATATA